MASKDNTLRTFEKQINASGRSPSPELDLKELYASDDEREAETKRVAALKASLTRSEETTSSKKAEHRVGSARPVPSLTNPELYHFLQDAGDRDVEKELGELWGTSHDNMSGRNSHDNRALDGPSGKESRNIHATPPTIKPSKGDVPSDMTRSGALKQMRTDHRDPSSWASRLDQEERRDRSRSPFRENHQISSRRFRSPYRKHDIYIPAYSKLHQFPTASLKSNGTATRQNESNKTTHLEKPANDLRDSSACSKRSGASPEDEYSYPMDNIDNVPSNLSISLASEFEKEQELGAVVVVTPLENKQSQHSGEINSQEVINPTKLQKSLKVNLRREQSRKQKFQDGAKIGDLSKSKQTVGAKIIIQTLAEKEVESQPTRAQARKRQRIPSQNAIKNRKFGSSDSSKIAKKERFGIAQRRGLHATVSDSSEDDWIVNDNPPPKKRKKTLPPKSCMSRFIKM